MTGGSSADAVTWCKKTLGPQWMIAAVSQLVASSATVLAIDVERDGEMRRLVLRLHDQPWFFEEEPDAIAREAAALAVVRDARLPAPELLGWSERDPPALLMTRIEGEPMFALPDPGAVSDVLEQIHELPTPAISAWTYRGYHEGLELCQPDWWRDARTWTRALLQTETARPPADLVFIHRDFHPGNLLWVGDRLKGVVDWVSACMGPAAFDVSHLRLNLAVLHSPRVANQLFPGDPAWDIEAAFGFFDWTTPSTVSSWNGGWPHVPTEVARRRFEAFVGEALARLG